MEQSIKADALLTACAEIINTLREETGNEKLMAQTAVTFLMLGARKEVALSELPELARASGPAMSRNIWTLLGPGTPNEPGPNLVIAEEDPYYRSRKLVQLTPRGKAVIDKMMKKVSRYLPIES